MNQSYYILITILTLFIKTMFNLFNLRQTHNLEYLQFKFYNFKFKTQFDSSLLIIS